MKTILSKLLHWCLPILLLASYPVAAERAVISLIIDDIGNNPDAGQAALALPGELVYSFLPGTPYATILAELAHEKGKQVIVHIPMEPEHHRKLGPDALTDCMPEQDYKATIINALQSVPHAVGLNNHMGSLLTQLPRPMKWLMEILLKEKLFFLDSKTTDKSIAKQTALNMGVKAFSRDVFLDNSRDTRDILEQFERLVRLAKHRGYATGIGHPYPETIKVLRQQIPLLASRGVRLVFASELLDRHINNRSKPWAVSSFPSHKVAKNSKP